MLVSGNNDVTITNDGATILNKMEVSHPAGRCSFKPVQTCSNPS
jgi:chaperonin GroEL (HSP60 family)